MQNVWSKVDQYLIDALIPQDAVLEAVLENNQRAGLPAIVVAANQGQLLALLVRISGATRILEIGTLGGYSTIWMARELPASGRLITLEADEHHARVARQNLRLAGVEERVEVRGNRRSGAGLTFRAWGDSPFRYHFYRCGQTEQSQLSAVGAPLFPSRDTDYRRQRGSRGKSHRS